MRLLRGQGWGSLCLPSLYHTPPGGCLTAGSSPLPPVWKDRHCSSSDEDTDVDVEGLRRRRGREPGAPQPVIPVDVEDQAKGEGAGGELGISLNMCLLGTLVLLGLGILLFSGE